MQILIANDTYGYRHHGCWATSHALRQLLLERFPGAVISANAVKAPSVMECLPFSWSCRRVAGHARGFCEERPDLVVMNGEGTLHACGHPVKRRNGGFLLRLLQARHALDRGIETWVVNHSLFTDRADYLALLETVYPRLAHCAVREPLSLPLVARLNSATVQSADCAFLTPLPPPATDSPLADAILLTDSSKRWSSDALARMRRLVALLQDRTGRPVRYLSITKQDEKVTRVAQPVGIPFVAYAETDEFLAHLQRAAFVLAGRYHTGVFAALCAVPFLTLRANTPKNLALLKLLNYATSYLDPETMVPEEAAALVEAALARRDEDTVFLAAQRPRLAALARLNVLGL